MPVAATPAPAAADTAAEEEDKPDLTATKVIAGAGAAATSAVLGSYLGATGTVAGAALGSVVSMIGASVYERYLERTRDTVRARVRLPGGRTVAVTEQLEVPAPRSAADADAAPTQVLVTPVDGPQAGGPPGVPAPRAAGPSVPTGAVPGRAAVAPVVAPRRRAWRWASVGAAVVLAFLIGMLVVTGLEWLKGSTLTSGQSGTSVGRVLDGGDRPPATADDEPGVEDATPTDEPGTQESSATTSPSETSDSSSTESSGTNSSRTTEPEPTATSPAPTFGVGPGR